MKAIDMKKLNDQLEVTLYTKLMEHLDTASGGDTVQMQRAGADITEIKVCSDNDGCDLVFANAPGKGIVFYYFGSGISPGLGTFVPLYGEKMTAGIDAAGHAYIFVLRRGRVYCVREKRPHSGSFGPEEELPVTVPKDFTGISQLETLPLREGLALFAVCETEKGEAYVSSHMIGDTYDYLVPVEFSRGTFAFSGDTKETVRIHQIYAKQRRSFYASCTMKEKKLRIYELEFNSDTVVSDLALLDSQVFLLSGNKKMWGLSASDERAVLTGVGEAGTAKNISLHWGRETVHAAAADESGRLIHFEMQKQGTAYLSTVPFPIDKNIGSVSFCQSREDTVLYYYSRQTASLVRLFYDPEQKNWNETIMNIPDPGAIQRNSCYSTEMTLGNPKTKVPYMDREVEIWTKQLAYIKTADGFWLCDENHKLRLKTDVRGKVSFAQYVDKIDVPVIYASLPVELLGNDQTLALCQSDFVMRQLKDITPQQVLDAKTTDSMGEGQGDLLPEKFRNQKNAEAISGALKQLMEMHSRTMRGFGRGGAYLISADEIGAFGRVSPADDLPAWSFRVQGDQLLYETLTKSEAKSRAAKLREGAVILKGPAPDGIFSSIADFFRSITKKIANLVEVVFNGIKATVKCILDGIALVFECIIGTIGEILDFVETIFTAVAVFFARLFAWLAALFQWEDVKRTQKALGGMFRIFLEEMPAFSQKYSGCVTAFLSKFEVELDVKIDAICQELLPGQPLLTYASSQLPSNAVVEEAMSNDYLTGRLMRITPEDGAFLAGADIQEYQDTLSDILTQMENFAESISETEEFKAAFHYFKQSFTSIDSLFQNLMVSLLYTIKGVLHFMLRGAAALTGVLFDAAESLCGAMLALVTKPIQLPFFSGLYHLMVGEELTLLNLITFVISVPVVTLYKLFCQKAPFESSQEVECLLADYRRLLRPNDKERDDLEKISKGVQDFLSYSGVAFGVLYNGLSGVSDYGTCHSQYRPGDPYPRPGVLDYIIWGLETAWLAVSVPWLFESETEPVKEYSIALWGCFALGTIIDTAFLFKATHIDKAGWKGRLCTSLYGFFHFCLILGITVQEKPEAKACIPDFFGSVTEMIKFLIDLDMTRSEADSWCVWPVCGTDGLTAAAVLVCGVI